MGIYINPTDDTTARSKEAKVKAKAAATLSPSEFVSLSPGEDGFYGVAIVDNGPFIAAGVAFSRDEARAFTRPDARRMEYYKLHIDAIGELDPGCAKLLRERNPPASSSA